jgi:membrane AbrB-like protein
MTASAKSAPVRGAVATFLIAALGGLAFELLGMPAGWLAGGMLAVAAASLRGLETHMPEPARWLIFLVLGIFAGSGATPATLDQIATWPASFAVLIAGVIVVTLASFLLLSRLFGWDPHTALFASLPGALSFIMAAVQGRNVDIRKVALAQSMRVLLLVLLFPLAVFITGDPSAGAAGRSALPAAMAPSDMLLLLGGGTLGGIVAYRLRLPGGLLLGGLLVSAGLFVSGTVSGEFPQWLVVPGMIGLGAAVGCRFQSGDRHLLPSIAFAALSAFCLVLLLSALSAWLASLWLGVSYAQTFLAFAPGALEAVTILAYAVDVDPAYFAAHHVVRFFALVLFVPMLARQLMGPERPTDA